MASSEAPERIPIGKRAQQLVDQISTSRNGQLFLLAYAVIAASFAKQRGWSGFLDATAALGILIIIYVAIRLTPRFPKSLTGVAMALIALAWFKLIGAAYPWIDAIAFGFAVAVAVILYGAWWLYETKKRKGLSTAYGIRDVIGLTVVYALSAWVALSFEDSYFMREEFRERTGAFAGRSVSQRWASVRVGVALSGGGYRAAVTHAGMLSALDDLQIPVSAMATVSGGSIIGSYYSIGGRPDRFRELVERRAFNLKRSLLHIGTFLQLVGSSRIIGTDYNLVPIPAFSRTDAQAAQLDRLLLDRARHESFGDSVPLPELMVATTDLMGARALGITPTGVIDQPILPPVRRTRFATLPPRNTADPNSARPIYLRGDVYELPGTRPLSELVAASGAFPGAFVPLHIVRTNQYTYSSGYSRTDSTHLLLVDGGVADNMGLALLRSAHLMAFSRRQDREGRMDKAIWRPNPDSGHWDDLKRWEVDLMLASDATAFESTALPGWGLARVNRAIDVLYMTTGGDPLPILMNRDLVVPPTLLLTPRDLPNTAQLPYGTDLPALPADSVCKDVPLPPRATLAMTGIRPDVLDTIVAHMPPDDRDAARSAIEALRTTRVLTQQGWSDANNKPTWNVQSRERELYGLVVEELSRRVRVFRATSTLDDQLEPEVVESLYLLGRYLVFLNQPFIEYWLDRAAARHAGKAGC